MGGFDPDGGNVSRLERLLNHLSCLFRNLEHGFLLKDEIDLQILTDVP
jgi:hypothetical protein